MIYVKRGATPEVLEATNQKKIEEMQQASAHFANPATVNASFDFKVYKEQGVIDALRSTFGPYCAYCESHYACVSPMDVEHFRPKGAFLDINATGQPELKKPGYWWLAATWENLLPSCPGCNRVWTQEFRLIEELTSSEKAGKGNWFPLAPGSLRAQKVGDEAHEQRLLLNPCEDDPAEHLQFDRDGMIRGMTLDGWASILTYGLDRDDLTLARAAHARSVMTAIRLLQCNLKNYELGQSTLDEVLETLNDIDALENGPYKALTLTLVREHLGGLVAECEKLQLVTAKLPPDSTPAEIAQAMVDLIGATETATSQ